MSVTLLLLACADDADRPRRPGEVVWTDGPIEGYPNAWRFDVDLPADVSTEVTCAHATDLDEVHVREGERAARQQITLFGLLADAEYSCELRAGDEIERRDIRTDPLPDWVPSFTVTTTDRDVGGYRLFNHGSDLREAAEPKLLVVDADGRVRWAFLVPDDGADDVDAQYVGNDCVLFGGGYEAHPTIVALDGTIELEAGEPSTGLAWHHHVERLRDWDVLALAGSTVEHDGRTWEGFSIERLEPALGAVRWTWDSQRGFDEGWLPAQEGDESDVYHANAIGELPDGDLFVSLREISTVAKLDATGGHQWSLGPGGDFALLDEDGAPASVADWFYGQHAPKFRTDDAGLTRVLLHDNGWERPGRQQSRAVELALDEEARTAQIVWQFTEPGWYEPIWGDADWLPAGHVLVTRAHCQRCTGDEDDRTELLEVDQATNDVVWRLTFHDPHDAGYRADWLDGCALFTNRKYCPDWW